MREKRPYTDKIGSKFDPDGADIDVSEPCSLNKGFSSPVYDFAEFEKKLIFFYGPFGHLFVGNL